MDRKIEKRLTADGVALAFTGSCEWCRVTLDGQRTVYLGADRFEIIRKRLLAALDESEARPVAGAIEGMPVSCALTLMEEHTSFFVAAQGAGLRVFLQNAEGEVFTSFSLSSDDCQRWREALSK